MLYEDKTIVVNINGDTVTLVSQSDGTTAPEEPKPKPEVKDVYNPEKNGEYTVQYNIFKKGTGTNTKKLTW